MLVSRARLIEQLSFSPAARPRLVLVSAPAGFGKTTVLSQWLAAAEDGGGRVAWLSLEPDDSDVLRLLTGGRLHLSGHDLVWVWTTTLLSAAVFGGYIGVAFNWYFQSRLDRERSGKSLRNLRIIGIDLDDNLLMVEGAVPGPKGGYIVIQKAKQPPRERRGFAGATTVDPLKAAKRAAKKG